MTTQLIDAFNRTAANLATSPTGRWSVQLLSGTTAAIAIDGQSAYTDSTWTSNTRGAAVWIGTDSGTNYGRWRALLRRSSTDITLIGLVFRSNNDDPSVHDRLFFGYDLAASGYALRRYSASTTIAITYGTSAATLDTDWHLFEVTQTSLGGGNVSMVAKVDGVTIFSVVVGDIQTVVSATERRGFGFEFASVSGGGWSAAADIGYCDYIEFDDLITGSAEVTPSLEADPVLTSLSVTTELDGLTTDELPTAPDWGELVASSKATIEIPTDADYVHTFPIHTVDRRRWSVAYSVLTTSAAGDIFEFLRDHITIPFKYADDAGTAWNVVFVEHSMTANQSAPNVVTDLRFEIEEVITA